MLFCGWLSVLSTSVSLKPKARCQCSQGESPKFFSVFFFFFLFKVSLLRYIPSVGLEAEGTIFYSLFSFISVCSPMALPFTAVQGLPVIAVGCTLVPVLCLKKSLNVTALQRREKQHLLWSSQFSFQYRLPSVLSSPRKKAFLFPCASPPITHSWGINCQFNICTDSNYFGRQRLAVASWSQKGQKVTGLTKT